MINQLNKMTLNVLLVEDNPGDILLFEEMITECRQPCNLKTSNSLATALDLLKEERFDAILADLSLPDSSGIDTFKQIQARAPDLPVVILTGFADQRLALEAIALGAQDYLVKGRYNSDSMHRSILYAIERKQAANHLRRAKELSDALNQINSLIFSTLSFDEIMNRVVEASAKATGADSAAIYFPDVDQWVAKYVYGLTGLAGRRVVPDDIRYSLLAVRERQPVLINNVPGHEEMCRLRIIQEYGVKALLDAPLLTGDDVVGNFALYSCERTEAFEEEHKEFVNKVSSSVAWQSGMPSSLTRCATANHDFAGLPPLRWMRLS